MYKRQAYDDATRLELLQTVCDEVDRLDRLVGNLLRMSAIESGALRPEPQAIDVGELVEHRLKVLSPLLRDHVVVMDVTDDCPLADADYGQMDEVLTNLLGNAVRHVPEGSKVIIRARELPIDIAAGEAFIEVAVVDHGPGIPEELRERIFEPFQKGPGSRSTGLGLAICRGIITAHGGTIRIDDTPGGGATIVFTIPARDSIDAGESNGDGSA